jgi:hypothetical protein
LFSDFIVIPAVIVREADDPLAAGSEVESRGCGVLDAPPARGMTLIWGYVLATRYVRVMMMISAL